ncbi:MAG: InlB B-repeat-containing protein, partial [Bacilli bacterium]
LYAKWDLVNYGVNYIMNGGTNNPNNPTSVNVESVSVNLQEPTKPGSRFLGWYSDSSFTTPISAVPGNRTSSFSIYAKWLDPVTVTFNVGGGSAIPSVSNLPGEVLSQPADPTRNGYTFDGWFTNSSFSTPYSFTTIPNQNTTIFAKWTALNFNITFNTNGGSAVDSLSFNTDQNITLPAAPIKVGHTFAGWYIDQALTQRFTSTKMPPNNVVLYAKWNVNIHQLNWTIEDKQFDMDVAYGSTLTSILPTPTKYQYDFLGWSIDGETFIDLETFTMPDEDVSLIAIFKDNLPPVVFTLTDGDTYAGGVDIIFNEGTALLDGEPVESGYRVNLPGTYHLILTDAAGNEVSITFTVIEESDPSLKWIIFAVILITTWLILAILYLLTRDKKPRGPGGIKPKRPKNLPVDKPILKEKPKSEKTVKKIEQEVPKPKPAPIPEKKVSPPKVAKPKVDLSKVVTKPIALDPQIEQELVTNEIFKAPLKIRKDPIENYDAPLKAEFNQTFVSDNRQVKVPELVYVPQTTNEAFYRNLFRYIHRFANVLSAPLLSNLTQTVVKLTTDEEAKLKIIEASTRTAEALSQQPPVEYLLKILRRNVALNRDVLNPRDKYVYSYQRLATLLEELGIYVEAVIVAREAYERGLIDTPEATFEKRLTRLEKKLIESDGKRQDMLRK